VAADKAWIEYWVKDPFWGAIDFLTLYGLRLFSFRRVSNIGASLGRLAAKYRFQEADRRSRENARRIFPQKTDLEIARVADTRWEHVGRTLTEMSVLDRIGPEQIAEVTFSREFREFDPTVPTLFLFPHLGNWEVLAYYVMSQNYQLNVIYERLTNRFTRMVARLNRERVGYGLIPADRSGAREILRKLGEGEAIGIAIDEYKNDNVISPACGRILVADSNITYAVKLAKKFNAKIILGYCVRQNDLRYKLYFHTVLPDDDGKTTAKTIDDVLEDWIREHPHQWYMLHRQFAWQPALGSDPGSDPA
jgi:KDO2-lipid IV(A) lauroyltransferase